MPDKKNEELNEGEMEQAAGGGAKFTVSSSQTENRGAMGEGEMSRPSSESDVGPGGIDPLDPNVNK
jgi:hypothetical protein